MISAFCSLINGGYYYQPHVVKEIQSPTGSTVYKNRGNVLRQTVTKQTSDFIKEALRDTVTDGTATPAAITGYDIGGKTGTAEKGKRTEKKWKSNLKISDLDLMIILKRSSKKLDILRTIQEARQDHTTLSMLQIQKLQRLHKELTSFCEQRYDDKDQKKHLTTVELEHLT